MLQAADADDYVIATGRTNTVKEFLRHVFDYAGLGDYNQYVEINPKYLRPHEVPYLLGNSTKAKNQLGWQPRVSFENLAQTMYEADLKEALRNV